MDSGGVRDLQRGQNMVSGDQITFADIKCSSGSNQGRVIGGQRGRGEESALYKHLLCARLALGVIQAIMLPNPSLHLTPYTGSITHPQGSEQAMGEGSGRDTLLKVRAG